MSTLINRCIGAAITLVLLVASQMHAQTIVKGKVTSASSGDPIPFANVVFNGTLIGATTDFDGNFLLQTQEKVDSITVSYVGYVKKTKQVEPDIAQDINFQLEEEVMNLKEIIFRAGENPANEILRRVVKNKDKNDKRSLEAYQYESYNKIEIDVDNISEKFRQKKILRKITQVLDSVDRIAGEDGKPILPMFISESLTQYYFRNNPKLQHEKILKTKISGVGVEDGSLISQFIGSSFQEYNFYQNWLNIVEKEFVSPIADGWKMYYEYDLTDSGMVDGYYCYRLDFFPKREQDLAFSGSMWITKEEYALRQIDATVTPSANLNYIEKIKIQQELIPTIADAWIPSKTRVLIDIGEITNDMAGVLAKFYTSNKNVVVNEPLDEASYARPIEMVESVKDNSNEFWDAHRHEPLSETEKSVYAMIDTLNNIPVVKTYTEILKIFVNGYKKFGPLDFGPYLSIYANNNIEGHRFQLGARTNIDFSNKWILGGYIAYGTDDDEFKYSGYIEYIADKEKWTSIRVDFTHDIDQVGLAAEKIANNQLFLTSTRFGDLKRPYLYTRYRISARRDLFKGFSQTLILRKDSFNPLYAFSYNTNPEVPDSPVLSRFKYTEVAIESRYAKDELVIVNDNQRISLGTLKWPVVTFRYTAGLKGFLEGDFEYHKLRLNLRDNYVMGVLGTSSVSLTGEQIFGSLPYPLLEAHIGNESIFYNSSVFNLMNYSEFISDRYITLSYDHHFQGFILNRIPIMKKLKWRLLATGNILYGNIGDRNHAMINSTDIDNSFELPNYSLKGEPYIEVGYGIENIFKVGRIDFIHRLTHLDKPNVNNFGIKLGLQFIL